LSGLAPGSSTIGDAAYIPRNADGGRIGIQSLSGFNTITDTPATAMNGVFVICSDGIVGKLAKQIDVSLDDGTTNTGSVRAVVSGTPSASLANADVTDSGSFTVCMAF
jgi:hypothetical protein